MSQVVDSDVVSIETHSQRYCLRRMRVGVAGIDLSTAPVTAPAATALLGRLVGNDVRAAPLAEGLDSWWAPLLVFSLVSGKAPYPVVSRRFSMWENGRGGAASVARGQSSSVRAACLKASSQSEDVVQPWRSP